MNSIRKHLSGLAAFSLIATLVCAVAFAADSNPDVDFVTQVFAFIKGFGGYAGLARVSAIIMLVIASMKVSLLQPLWAKLGNFQIWLAPILGLAGGLAASLSGGAFSWAAVSAYVLAGAGAVYLHELLDLIKMIPGLGPIWVSVISLIQSLPGLGSGAQAVSAQSVAAKK